MRMRVTGLIALLALAPALAGAADTLAPEKVRVNELLQDTQRASPSMGDVDLVWWIPPQFWDASLAQNGDTPEAERRAIVALFEQYTVVAVVDGRLGVLGVDGFASAEEVRKSLRIVDPDGGIHTPLEDKALSPQFVAITAFLKPILANVIGEMGNNLHFFAFPARTADGRPVADPLGKGHFTVRLHDREFRYRLPLGSLLVPQRDAATGEEFPGSYRFNPYTGAELAPVRDYTKQPHE